MFLKSTFKSSEDDLVTKKRLDTCTKKGSTTFKSEGVDTEINSRSCYQAADRTVVIEVRTAILGTERLWALFSIITTSC